MKSKSLAILAIGAAAALGIGMLVSRAPAPAANVTNSLLLADLAGKAESIARIEMSSGSKSVVLTKGADGAWAVASKASYKADIERIRTLVRGLAEARVLDTKTSKPEFYERLGVQDPAPTNSATSVMLADAAGASLASLIVGNRDTASAPQNATGEDAWPRWFIRKSGDPQTLLIRANITLDADAISWMPRVIIEMNSERMRSVVVQHPAGPLGASPADRISASRTSSTDAKFTMDWMPEGRALKDDFATTRLANTLSSITFDDVRPAAEADTTGDAIVSEYRTFDGLLITARTRTIDNARWTTFTAAVEPVENQATAVTESVQKEAASLTAAWTGWAFKIADWKLETLAPSMEALLAPPPETTPPAPTDNPLTPPTFVPPPGSGPG